MASLLASRVKKLLLLQEIAKKKILPKDANLEETAERYKSSAQKQDMQNSAVETAANRPINLGTSLLLSQSQVGGEKPRPEPKQTQVKVSKFRRGFTKLLKPASNERGLESSQLEGNRSEIGQSEATEVSNSLAVTYSSQFPDSEPAPQFTATNSDQILSPAQRAPSTR